MQNNQAEITHDVKLPDKKDARTQQTYIRGSGNKGADRGIFAGGNVKHHNTRDIQVIQLNNIITLNRLKTYPLIVLPSHLQRVM